eukprot:TRINITY_DN6265_c0_g1_i4.p1 TRINITY_DN6265_c0_g1~~TRINITY_DN6265_c0_g1_i4.p1  ORF type:complete len:354 (-),score=50.30 TRINITY_DN6265_c0_g1_i4:67-1128(-)
MRIFSWNVNGLRAVAQKLVDDPLFNPSSLKGPNSYGKALQAFFEHHKADIVCLQETKCSKLNLLEDSIVHVEGYESFWSFSTVKNGYSGTATYVKKGKTLDASNTPFLEPELNTEGRTVMTDHKHFVLFNCYFPNATKGEDRLKYKMDFCTSLEKLCHDLKAQGRQVIVVGDLNIAHHPIDNSYADKEERACYLTCEREWLTGFLSKGFVDTFRHRNPETVCYSWWDMKTFKRATNEGIRLDYCIASSELLENIQDSLILFDQHGSDHCPCALDLKEFESFEVTEVPLLSSEYKRKKQTSIQSFFKPKDGASTATVDPFQLKPSASSTTVDKKRKAAPQTRKNSKPAVKRVRK